MPSPFPGMDPYLEAHWRDVHASLILYSRDALQGGLPPSLRARVEERVLVETPRGLGDHPLHADVRVVEYASRRGLALVDQCYRNGAYEGTIDYAIDPDPPLFGADDDWADERLHELGLRPHKKPARGKGKPR